MSDPRPLDLDFDAVTVSAKFDREKIDRTEDYEGNLMVSLHAEDKEFDRTPVCVALVLDVSASMSGDKIASLREVACKVVDNLTEKDEVSVITYSDNVEVLVERTKVTSKEVILNAIRGIHTRSATNMSGGLLAGIRQIDETFQGVQRVLLLTDGLANRGVMAPEQLIKMVKDRDSKCTVSTFAFGSDADQNLLDEMAKAGAGNFNYIKDTADIGNVFARELGGLVSCVAQNIEVKVIPAQNNEIQKILNDYTVEDKDGAAIIEAEDIYVGENKFVLANIKVAKPDGKPKDREFSIARVEVTYDVTKTGVREKSEFNIKVRFTKPEDADKEPVLDVAEQAAMLDIASAQKEAVIAASSGNHERARGIIIGAKRRAGSLRSRSKKVSAYLDDHTIQEENYARGLYSATFGATARGSAKGMMKMRATGGLSDKLYMNSSSETMQTNFAAQPPSITDDSSNEGIEVDSNTTDKSSFAKKRNH